MIKPLNKNIAQLWTASVACLMLISGPFMLGFISLVFSEGDYSDNLLMLLYRDKQGSFLMLLVLGIFCWYVPRILFREHLPAIINPYLFKILSMVLIINLAGHGLYNLLPDGSPLGLLILLINFLLWAYFWFRIGAVFYRSPGIPVWNSPITLSYFIIAAIFMGLSLLLFFPNITLNYLKIWLIVFLLLDIILLVSHFNYVAKSSEVTSQTAKLYFTRYLIFFVLRVLFGLIIPLIFIVLNFFWEGYPVQIIAPSLMLAQIAKIILFFFPVFVVYPEIKTDNGSVSDD